MRFYRRTLLERLFARWGICGVERLMFGLIKTPSPWIKFRSADSSSTNTVSFSSARTIEAGISVAIPVSNKDYSPAKIHG